MDSEVKWLKNNSYNIIYYPARQDGSYEYINDSAVLVYEYVASGSGESATITSSAINDTAYYIAENLKQNEYYIRPIGKKKLEITVENSLEPEDDGIFKLRKGATLLLDGIETVTVKNGEIVSFYFASNVAIKNIVEKYPERFDAPALVVIRSGVYIGVIENLAMILFD